MTQGQYYCLTQIHHINLEMNMLKNEVLLIDFPNSKARGKLQHRYGEVVSVSYTTKSKELDIDDNTWSNDQHQTTEI